jgi:tetratricopeptide (TPR) repeat protein
VPRSVRRLCGCVLAATVVWLAACGSSERRFAEHVRRAEQHAAEGRIPEAVLEYQSALELEPRDAEIHERVGDLLAQRREFKDAISYYRQAFELDPERIGAAMNEARLLAFGEPKRARELVQIGLERAPDRPEVQLARAHVALAAGDVNEALAAAQRAVEIDRESGVAWAQLGQVQQARIRKNQLAQESTPPNVYEGALDAFAQVDRLARGDTRAQVERARIFGAWSGHREQALAAFRAAIAGARQRADVDGRRFAARSFDEYAKQEQDPALRREALREVVEADEDDYEAWSQLARLSGRQRGEAVCRELIARRPDDPHAHRVMANYLQRKRGAAAALAHLHSTIQGGLRAPQLWEQIVGIQLSIGRGPDARDTYAELAQAFPDDPVTRSVEARLAVEERRFADAAVILRELVKVRETSDNQRLLAIAEQRLGNLPAATTAIDRALALAPNSFALYRNKASIHHDAKQWGKVLLAYRALAGRGFRLSPADEVRRARALYESGKPDAARSVLAQVLALPNPPADAAIEFARREGATQYAQARRTLLDASLRSPGDPRLIEALLQLDLAAGHPDLALVQIDAEIAGGRARPRTLLLRAHALVLQGDLARAEAELLRAFEAEPRLPGAAELLFDIYRRQGRLADARRSFEQAAAAGLLHPGTRLLLAQLYLSQGELARAQAVLEQVVVEQPGLASARNDLAFVLASNGDQLERALELAVGARAELGENEAAIDTLGYVYFRSGRLDEALAEFQHAIALAGTRSEPVSPTYSYHLGLVLEALGRKQEAARAFEGALAGEGEFPEAADARRRLESVLATSPAGANPS